MTNHLNTGGSACGSTAVEIKLSFYISAGALGCILYLKRSETDWRMRLEETERRTMRFAVHANENR